MHVEFFIGHERKRICAWSARIGRHTVPGAVMASGNMLPHDLAQYVIESAAEYALGFWGLLAKGATYKSTKQRITKPGRAVIVRHRPELNASELLAGHHMMAWRAGERSPVTEALDAALTQWRALHLGEAIAFEWPSPHGTVGPLTLGHRHLARSLPTAGR